MIWWKIEEVPPPKRTDVLFWFPAKDGRDSIHSIGQLGQYPYIHPTHWALLTEPGE